MSTVPRVTHYGSIQIGDIALECVVLGDDGEVRAYIQKQLVKAIGFVKNRRGTEARQFLQVFAPNYLSELEKTNVPHEVKMPHGNHAKIYEAGILTEITSNVIGAALDGTLKHQHRHLVKPCMAIMRALAKTGETALIDEATGYQHHRAPDALQDLFGRLVRETCSDWERRFHPDYYAALYRLFGWEYKGQSQRPLIIGQITDQVVYGAIFPAEIMAEIRERRGGRLDRLHQWLKDGGLSLLEKQIAAVTMIARSSTDYQDFKNRCLIAFHSLGQMGFVFPSQEAAQ
jgi:hypothetical protein